MITDYLKRTTNNAACQNGTPNSFGGKLILEGVFTVVASRDPVYVTVTNDDLIRIMASSSRLLLESFTNIGFVDLDISIENPTNSEISVNFLGMKNVENLTVNVKEKHLFL